MLSSKNLTAIEATGYHGKDNDRTFEGRFQSKFRSCWFGKGAATLNLQGEVAPDAFNQLALGIDLAGNSLHAKPIKLETHRAGTDFCFSAPKSVSIAALLQQDRRVIVAHNHAVQTALSALENRCSQARIWNRKQRRQERIHTGNIVAALLPHSTSRNQDPQLHTHAFVFNATQLQDGTWRALSNEEMVAMKKFVGEIYQNQLAYNLRQLRYEVEPRKNGQFGLKGYSKPLCDLFSTRRQQIEAYAEQSERPKDYELYEQATLHTRQHKKETPLEALIEGWRRTIAEHGLELPPIPQADQTQDLSEIGKERAATAAIAGLEIAESREFEFQRETIEQSVLENSVGQQSWTQLQTALEEMNQLIAINLSLNLYTTQAAAKRKQLILEAVQQGWGAVHPLSTLESMTEVDTEFLSQERRQALEMATTSADQFMAWQGIGKDETTYALKLYRQIAENQGYCVREFNPQSDLNSSEKLSNEIWIVKEAESLTTQDLHDLVQRVEVTQSRVLFIGDAREPQSGLFKTLPKLGITTVNLGTGERFMPDKQPELITLTYSPENTNARNQTWEKATTAERNSRTSTDYCTNRRSHAENCVEQSVGERIGVAIGKRIGEQFATTQPEDRSLIRETGFSGIDLEQTACGIAETIERRAIEQCSQDLSRAIEKIDGCLQQYGSDLQRLEGVLRELKNHIERTTTIHHRATSEISARGVTDSPVQTLDRSQSAPARSQPQEAIQQQDELDRPMVDNAEIELEPLQHEWLPERSDRGWETVRQQLVTEYKIPDWLLQKLHEQGWIYSDKKNRAVFVERTLDDEKYHGLTLSNEGYLHPTDPKVEKHLDSCFWMATAESIQQAIVLDDPLEALAIYALDQTGSKKTPTLYLAAMRVEQLPFDVLQDVPKVRVSTSCENVVKQALKEGVPQSDLIAPRHSESWRGVWRDYVERSERQVSDQTQVTSQLQI